MGCEKMSTLSQDEQSREMTLALMKTTQDNSLLGQAAANTGFGQSTASLQGFGQSAADTNPAINEFMS